MSLINDALKKAQQERANPPPPPGQTPVGFSPPPSPTPRRFSWGLLAVILVSCVGTALFLRWFDSPASSSVAASAPSPTPTSRPAPESSPVAAAVTSAPTPTPLPTPTPVVSPEAEQARRQAFVDRFRITGIRLSSSGNRALINDRLVRVGDLLDPVSGLTVHTIETNAIVCIDPQGRTYRKAVP